MRNRFVGIIAFILSSTCYAKACPYETTIFGRGYSEWPTGSCNDAESEAVTKLQNALPTHEGICENEGGTLIAYANTTYNPSPDYYYPTGGGCNWLPWPVSAWEQKYGGNYKCDC